MNKKLRVGVVFGGRSGEHEVSLVSATHVMAALNPEKYEVVPIAITNEGKWLSSANALAMLKHKRDTSSEPERVVLPGPHHQGLVMVNGHSAEQNPLDVIFPVVHGTYGEDGTLQGLLELADIPYVGAGVLGSAVGMDKVIQKFIYAQHGIPVVKSVWFLSAQCREGDRSTVAACEKSLRYPMFVKPANTGSSVGITKAHDKKELVEALKIASQFDRKVIVEQGINGIREIECSVLGNDDPVASVPGEIIPSNEFYDYDAKYVDGKSVSVIPAKIPKKTARLVQALAVKGFKAIDCAGMARVDFFLTRSGKVYLNEINTIPGFTPISMYPKMWEASGLPYAALLDRLIELALERHSAKSSLRTTYTPSIDWYRGPA